MDGDRATADYYYAKAREADQSSMRVAYATRKDVEGMKLAAVAGDSDDAVIKATEEAAAARRAQGGPVILRYRDNQPVVEPATPTPQPETTTSAPTNNNGFLAPLPDNRQPPVVHRPPESQQQQGPVVHRPPRRNRQPRQWPIRRAVC